MSTAAPTRASRLQVAEAMYQAGKAGPGPKMPDSLDELNVPTQQRYLLLAEAAIAVIGEPAAAPAFEDEEGAVDLMAALAEELAWKLNHPQQFSDRVREVLGAYAETVGDSRITDEVRKAMAL